MRIKEIPINERPRERLIDVGVSNLSDLELLAIIIKDGTKNKSSKDISIDILNSVNDVTSLKDINLNSLLKIKGIGISKACSLLSSIELGKRIFLKKNYNKKVILKSSKDIYEYIKYSLINKDQEYFYCLYVNSRKELIERKLLFMGTVNRSTVHPREIFKNAYLASANGIICIHNHPSGDINPSKEDILLTDSLVEIGIINGISLIDHIIVGNDNYYSFFDNNKIM